MAVYRAQIGFPMDSALPRDVVTINPHFQGTNAQGLADALKTNLLAHPSTATKPFNIKVYDAEKAPPSYPLAQATAGTGQSTSNVPRELALCLSYYGGFNRPTYRGRLYIPMSLVASTLGLRPTGSEMSEVGTWATILTNGLPAETFWSVWSTTTRRATITSHWWVDDEWDIIRSRGMRPTTRVEGTV
jgi:hypothetical protein